MSKICQNLIPDPNIQYYHPDGMKPDKRERFLEWYEEHKMTNLMSKRNF